MIVDELKRDMEAAFATDERAAGAFLKDHAWLLIPNVTPKALGERKQGAYAEVALDDQYRVDFAVYFVESSELHWELVEIQSPNARIWVKNGHRYSADLAEAQHQIDRWRAWRSNRGRSASERFPNIHNRCDFRIVLGRSDQMDSDEREKFHELRATDVRVRTFCWFYEKVDSFSPSELAELEANAPARSQRDLIRDRHILSTLTT